MPCSVSSAGVRPKLLLPVQIPGLGCWWASPDDDRQVYSKRPRQRRPLQTAKKDSNCQSPPTRAAAVCRLSLCSNSPYSNGRGSQQAWLGASEEADGRHGGQTMPPQKSNDFEVGHCHPKTGSSTPRCTAHERPLPAAKSLAMR
ncbi:hypothetical protein HJFPF1_13013 [Paramyrothecium foliicola]|nr:hypothetical protein HJFPF1_13013 [Paramyrothecium foliicola]